MSNTDTEKRESWRERLKREYRGSLKSADTEEWFDLHFYRPLGFLWACLGRWLHLSPNVITIASIFLGVGAGICFYYDNIWINIAGVLLLMWADTFDSADGQLARMTGQYSRIGRILDGFSSDLWFVSIYVCICLREVHTSAFFEAHHWVIWVLAVSAGICHATQAAMGDYYRQFHLFFINGKAHSELENSDTLVAQYNSLSWGQNFWRKLLMTFYVRYTLAQEGVTKSMQRLRRQIAKKWPEGVPADFVAAFRKLSLPLIKYTNILSFNVRSFALFASILIFRMPWLYFAFELTVMNGLLVYMVVKYGAVCRELTRKIENHEY